MSCSRTQHGDSSGVRPPDFWIQSPRCQPPGHRAPIRFGGQDMTLLSMLPDTVRCTGFHYHQVTTLVAGLGIVAFTEGLHYSSIFLVTPQV